MRVTAVVVKQRTILPTTINATVEANLNATRTRRSVIASHNSKHTKKNCERGKNRVGFNAVCFGRRPWYRSHRTTYSQDVASPRRHIRAAHPVAARKEGTVHFFTGWAGGRRMDWILASSHFQTIDAGIDHTREPDGYPSDHFPATATLRAPPPPHRICRQRGANRGVMRWVRPIWAPNPSCVASRCPERIGLATAQRSGSAESFGRFLKQIFDGLESEGLRGGAQLSSMTNSVSMGAGEFAVRRNLKWAASARWLAMHTVWSDGVRPGSRRWQRWLLGRGPIRPGHRSR